MQNCFLPFKFKLNIKEETNLQEVKLTQRNKLTVIGKL